MPPWAPSGPCYDYGPFYNKDPPSGCTSHPATNDSDLSRTAARGFAFDEPDTRLAAQTTRHRLHDTAASTAAGIGGLQVPLNAALGHSEPELGAIVQ